MYVLILVGGIHFCVITCITYMCTCIQVWLSLICCSSNTFTLFLRQGIFLACGSLSKLDLLANKSQASDKCYVTDPFSPHSILQFYILLKEALHTDLWCHYHYWMESLLSGIRAMWTQGQQQSDSHGGFQVANRRVLYTTWIRQPEGWPHPRHDTTGRRYI